MFRAHHLIIKPGVVIAECEVQRLTEIRDCARALAALHRKDAESAERERQTALRRRDSCMGNAEAFEEVARSAERSLVYNKGGGR